VGVNQADIALTDSTSMGLALLYSGLKVKPGDEVLTTNHDHYACEAALLVCAERTGCAVKRINFYRDASKATADEIVDAVRWQSRFRGVWQSFDMRARRIERADQLFPALKSRLESGAASLIDCPIDYRENEKLSQALGEVICRVELQQVPQISV
jgi:hypothetical protein